MNEYLVLKEQPELNNPYIFIGMTGWLNAGEVSTGSIDFLRRSLRAREFAHIDPRSFYVYQVPGVGPEQMMRPRAVIDEGLIKGIELPKNVFYHCKSGNDRDLILFSGYEPNLQWPEFAQAVMEMARRYRAVRIFLLGSVFDHVPHTRETRFFAVVSRPHLKDELNLPCLTYTGPCSFSTLLLDLAGREGIEAAAVSVRVPPYIQNFNPKAAYDLLKKIISFTPLEIDLTNLRISGEALIETMDKAFGQNETALEQLKRLEEIFDAALLQEIGRVPGTDYDKLLQEMLNMKREGRKPH